MNVRLEANNGHDADVTRWLQVATGLAGGARAGALLIAALAYKTNNHQYGDGGISHHVHKCGTQIVISMEVTSLRVLMRLNVLMSSRR